MNRAEVEKIEALKLIRAVVGFVRAGVVVQPVLVDRAARFLEQIKSSSAEGELERTEKILAQVQRSILPSIAACENSLLEIEAVLSPMLQAQRAAQAIARAKLLAAQTGTDTGADTEPSAVTRSERDR